MRINQTGGEGVTAPFGPLMLNEELSAGVRTALWGVAYGVRVVAFGVHHGCRPGHRRRRHAPLSVAPRRSRRCSASMARISLGTLGHLAMSFICGPYIMLQMGWKQEDDGTLSLGSVLISALVAFGWAFITGLIFRGHLLHDRSLAFRGRSAIPCRRNRRGPASGERAGPASSGATLSGEGPENSIASRGKWSPFRSATRNDIALAEAVMMLARLSERPTHLPASACDWRLMNW